MEMEEPELFAQYRDCLTIVDRRLSHYKNTLKATGIFNSDHWGATLALTSACEQRVTRVSNARAPVLIMKTVPMPDWYLEGECKADESCPWRLAAAIERLGVRVFAPVKVIVPSWAFSKLTLMMSNANSYSAIEAGELLIDAVSLKISRRVVNRPDPELDAIGYELLVRLTKLVTLFRGGASRPGPPKGPDWDSVGVNSFEDAVEPEILINQANRWLLEG